MNLLHNAGFDGGYRAWNGLEEITVAEGWLPFWVSQQPEDPAWKNRRPVYRAALRALEPFRARSGPAAQMYGTSWATHVAGLMQSVTVVQGQPLRLTAYGHSWSTNGDVADQSIDPGNVRLKVGIDPYGGQNPFDERIIWSAQRVIYDGFAQPLLVDAVAQSSSITVYLISSPEWPKKHNDVYWDDVSLEAVSVIASSSSGDRDVLLTLNSGTQQVGFPVSIQVTSGHALTNPNVLVSGPQGAVRAAPGITGEGGRGYVWQSEFVPPMPGPYTVTFTLGDVAAVSSSIQISRSASRPQSNSTISSGNPQGGAGRGMPRTQYKRVYLLLPPSAGGEWLSAIAASGAWANDHWTVGYSADDAGIGDLDHRTVLVLNAPAWPEPILPWLEMWYPGMNVVPVTAVTPKDLIPLLQTLTLSNTPELG
jgi:hypothetical protein